MDRRKFFGVLSGAVAAVAGVKGLRRVSEAGPETAGLRFWGHSVCEIKPIQFSRIGDLEVWDFYTNAGVLQVSQVGRSAPVDGLPGFANGAIYFRTSAPNYSETGYFVNVGDSENCVWEKIIESWR